MRGNPRPIRQEHELSQPRWRQSTDPSSKPAIETQMWSSSCQRVYNNRNTIHTLYPLCHAVICDAFGINRLNSLLKYYLLTYYV